VAKSCACYGACMVLAAAGVLTGCVSGSSSMVNAISPTTNASISTTSYDFGQDTTGHPQTQTVVEVTNTGANLLTLNPTLIGSADAFAVVPAQSCGSTLAAAATCSVVVTYTPTSAGRQTSTLNLGLANVPLPLAPGLVTLTGSPAIMKVGTVTATNNPQVALYTITSPVPGVVTVNFGPTTNYGMQTWSVATPSGGGPVSIYVAGMFANATYHMQAAITPNNGITFIDADHTFTTTSYPANLIPEIAASTPAGQTPQPGIEMLNPNGATAEIVATDLEGRALWEYVPAEPTTQSSLIAPKQLPNGDFIFVFAEGSSIPVKAGTNPEAPNLIREIDLAGNTVKQITMVQLNAELAAANYNLTLQVFHHDIAVLPNGHWLVLANTLKNVVLDGQTTPTEVLGDVIVDLDTNLNPVWVWNEFDHLDVNRHPVNFPDWTHTNAVVYSKDDGNLLVSMRHQSWIVKVDYNNGAGTGNVIWRLGEGGDFKLVGGTDPTDWFYGQHGMSFTTQNTTGIFGLVLMDNGDFRLFPSGVTCGTGSAPPCLYSTIPVLQINEAAMTATLQTHQILPASLYSFFGGNAQILPNGNLEYDLCGLPNEPNAQIFETPNQSTPQTVLNMTFPSTYVYRAYRLPSLYPGVQW
jgi:arylsulfate sulfotransferase